MHKILLIITFMLLTTNLWAADTLTINDVEFTESSGTIVKYLGSSTNIVIPAQLNNSYVRVIGSEAFRAKGVVSVTLPDSIVFIESYAFAENPLEEITLGNSLWEVEYKAFYNCQLKSVTFSDTIYNIGAYAFAQNQINNLTLPHVSNKIEEYAFWKNQLSEVTIPYGQKTVAQSTFASNKLTSVSIPVTVEAIEKSAFENNLLVNLELPIGLTHVKERAFKNNKLESISFPLTLIRIWSESFAKNNLSKISLPASIEDIGDSALANNNTEVFTLPQIKSPTLKGWWSDGNQIIDITTPVPIENSYVTQFTSGHQPISFEIKSDSKLSNELIGFELVIANGYTPGVSNWKGKGVVRNVLHKTEHEFILQKGNAILATGTVSTSYIDGTKYEYTITGQSEKISGEGTVPFKLEELPISIINTSKYNKVQSSIVQNGILKLSPLFRNKDIIIQILSPQGRIIWNNSVSSKVNLIKLPSISSGVYFLRISDNNINKTIKLKM